MAHKLLDAVGVSGASAAVILSEIVGAHTVQIMTTTAATAVVIDLEGSLSNRGTASPTWFALASYTFTAADLAAKKAMFHVADKPVKQVRLNLTTYTPASGTLTALYTPAEVV